MKNGSKINKFGMLFDLDGTLVNSLPDITGVLNMLRREESLPELTPVEVRPHIGKGASHLVRGCFPGLDPQNYEQLITRLQAHYLTTPLWGGRLYPQVRESLERMRRDPACRIAVVTNKPTPAAHVTLDYYLPGFKFDEVAGPEMVSEKKPSPRHLTEVMGRLGLEPENCVFVGDDQVDVDCAAAAQVPFFAAAYGFGRITSPPRESIQTFAELFERVPRLKDIG